MIPLDQHESVTDLREPSEPLEQIAYHLRLRVSNWYGIDTHKSVSRRITSLCETQAESISGSEGSSFTVSISSQKTVHTGKSCSATCSIMFSFVSKTRRAAEA